MSVRAFPFPKHPHFGKFGWCKWCGKTIPLVIDGKRSTQRMWHPGCWDEAQLHTRAAAQYDWLVTYRGERCALCPEGAPLPMRWKHGDVLQIFRQSCWGWKPGVAGWWDDFQDRPPGRYQDWTEEERATGQHMEIERVVALEVDHRVPLWSVAHLPDEERRWYFGPGNLWLLCPKHHKEKTRREAAERAALKAFAKAQLVLPL